MGNNILGIGISGLNAAQANLLTTGHNISNVDTPGYNRQKVVQATNTPQSTNSGYIGSGVNVSTVERVYNQFLVSQSLQAQTKSSQLESYFTQISQINNMLADSSAGLSPALQGFFGSVQNVATNPASVPSRQAMLSNSEALVTRLQGMDQQLSEIREGINSQTRGSVTEINSLAEQVAKLNYNIKLSAGVAGGQPPNDLLDQREALTTQLGKLVNTSVVRQDDNSINIFIGTGQPLVVGNQAMALKAVPSPDDPAEITIGYSVGNKTVLIPEGQLQGGGSLGGLLAFRNEALNSAQNALGRLSLGLAQNFNAQHRLGQDLKGNMGGDYFSVPGPKVISVAGNNSASNITASIADVNALTTSEYKFAYDGTNYSLTRLSDNVSTSTAVIPSGATPLTLDGVSISGATINSNESFIIQPAREGAKNISVAIKNTAEIAAAAPIRTSGALSNTGSGTISAGSVNPLPVDPDLQQLVTITFHSPLDGQFDVTGGGAGLPSLNQVYTEGADISIHGFTVQINGNPAAGDTFTIGPNSNGNNDNRNALLLGGLQTQNLMIGGTATFQATYGQLVSEIGNKTRELEVTGKAQGNLLSQINQSIQSLSGVNLDEEAANLLRYQQAYQASGKIIEISSKLFESLINIR